MKIAEIVATFPPERSGMGNVCYQNSIQLGKMGNDVSVFTTKTKSKIVFNDDNVKVIQLEPCIRFGNAPILPGLVKTPDCDVIHLHLPFFFGSEMMLLVSKFRDIPVAVTYHHDAILKPPLNAASFFYMYTLHQLISQAKVVFVTSLDYAYNCSIRKILTSSKNLIELPVGVDTSRFNPKLDGRIIRKQLGIEAKENVILFVGGLDRPHYFKGVQFLLPAFSQLDKKSCSLIIVGEGELKPHFKQLAKRLGIEKQTFFVGNVPDERLPLYYASSDFLVLPSFAMNEAFGKVLIEAMSSGKAIIASNLPGVRSVVSEGKNGLLVEPTDVEDLFLKMKFLIENPEIREKFGINGRKKAESEYNWATIGLRLYNSLRRVVENGRNS